jgi:hypothetical protein
LHPALDVNASPLDFYRQALPTLTPSHGRGSTRSSAGDYPSWMAVSPQPRFPASIAHDSVERRPEEYALASQVATKPASRLQRDQMLRIADSCDRVKSPP